MHLLQLFDGLLYLLLVNGYPVRGRVPLVAFDVVHTVLQISVSFCQVNLQQIAQKVLQVGAEVGWKSYLRRQIDIDIDPNY